MWFVLSAAAVEVVVGPDQPTTSIDQALALADTTSILLMEGSYTLPDLGVDVQIRGSGRASTEVVVWGPTVVYEPATVGLSDLTLRVVSYASLHVPTGATATVDRVTVLGDTNPVDSELHEPMLTATGALTLRDCELVAGWNTSRAAQLQIDGGTATIERTVFASAVTYSDSGAVVVAGGTATFTDTQWRKSSGSSGAALWYTGGATTITGSTFEENDALIGSGGAIYGRGGSLELYDTTLVRNTSVGDGGAVYVEAGASFTAQRSVFLDNSAPSTGAGIRCASARCTVLDSRFEGNSASQGAALSSDAGGEAVTIGRTAFCGNVAGPNGGAVYLHGSNNTFASNLLWNNDGGGVTTAGGQPVRLENLVFAANRNPDGAAVHGSVFQVFDSLFIGHDSPDGLLLTFAGNPGDASLSHNAYFSNTVGPQTGSADAGFNLLDQDPLLHVWPPRSCDVDDFRLREGSPLIGKGSNIDEDIGIFSGALIEDPLRDEDGDGVPFAYDCLDTSTASVRPLPAWSNDRDGDLYADADDPGTEFEGCPHLYATRLGDCDDSDPDIHPGIPEDRAGADLDCDGWNDPAVRAERACQTGGSSWGLLGLALALGLTRWRRSASGGDSARC